MQEILGKEVLLHSTPPRPIVINEGKTVILTFPIIGDNYSYGIIDTMSGEVGLVDPSDAASVLRQLWVSAAMASFLPPSFPPHLTITTVLCTHWHHDHSGGNVDLLSTWQGRLYQEEQKRVEVAGEHDPASTQRSLRISAQLQVVSSERDMAPGRTTVIQHQKSLTIGSKTTIWAISTPGHTHGHLCFLTVNAEALFSGDCLFVAGLGKLFEGTAAEAYASLYSALLPFLSPATLLFPGHEYAAENLQFACHYFAGERERETRKGDEKEKTNDDDDENDDDCPLAPVLNQKKSAVEQLRRYRRACIPSRWQDELTYNPYLQLSQPPNSFTQFMVKKWPVLTPHSDPVHFLAHIRSLKDRFSFK